MQTLSLLLSYLIKTFQAASSPLHQPWKPRQQTSSVNRLLVWLILEFCGWNLLTWAVKSHEKKISVKNYTSVAFPGKKKPIGKWKTCPTISAWLHFDQGKKHRPQGNVTWVMASFKLGTAFKQGLGEESCNSSFTVCFSLTLGGAHPAGPAHVFNKEHCA